MGRYGALLLFFSLAGCLTRTTAETFVPGPRQDATINAKDGAKNWDQRFVRVSVLIPATPGKISPWLQREDLLQRWLAEEVRIGQAEDSEFILAWPSRAEELHGRVLHQEQGRGIECTLSGPPGADGTTLRIALERSVPGYTRVFMKQGPFTGGMEGEGTAEAYRVAWSRALAVLRVAVTRALPTSPAPPPHLIHRKESGEAEREPPH